MLSIKKFIFCIYFLANLALYSQEEDIHLLNDQDLTIICETCSKNDDVQPLGDTDTLYLQHLEIDPSMTSDNINEQIVVDANIFHNNIESQDSLELEAPAKLDESFIENMQLPAVEVDTNQIENKDAISEVDNIIQSLETSDVAPVKTVIVEELIALPTVVVSIDQEQPEQSLQAQFNSLEKIENDNLNDNFVVHNIDAPNNSSSHDCCDCASCCGYDDSRDNIDSIITIDQQTLPEQITISLPLYDYEKSEVQDIQNEPAEEDEIIPVPHELINSVKKANKEKKRLEKLERKQKYKLFKKSKKDRKNKEKFRH